MDRRRIVREDMQVTLLIVTALWGAAVLGAWAADVFDKLATEEIVTLAFFATAFAVGAYRLDSELRAFGRGHPATLTVASVLDAIVLAKVGFIAESGIASGSAMPLSLAATLLFLLPLGAATTWAAVDGIGERRRLSSARGKSPGATPAAT
jgi:hypothetical protein